MTNMMKTIARSYGLAVQTVFGVLALGCTALPALAVEPNAPQHAVHYSDLDMSQESGATVLYRRIGAAARGVCAQLDRADLSSKTRYKACVNKAIDDAVIAVNQPTLFAVYQAKRGPSRLSIASLDSQQARSP